MKQEEKALGSIETDETIEYNDCLVKNEER